MPYPPGRDRDMTEGQNFAGTQDTVEGNETAVQVAQATDQASTPAPSPQASGQAVTVQLPGGGATVAQPVQPGQAIDIAGADASAMILRQDGDMLVLDFGAAGSVELTGYFTAAQSDAPPTLTINDSFDIPVGQLIAAVTGDDPLPDAAAGPAAGPAGPAGSGPNHNGRPAGGARWG